MDDRVLKATKQWTLVQPVVSAYVGAIVRDFAARDDVLQEIAIAVLDAYDRYDASRSFQSWALGIARNQVRSYLRSAKRDLLTFDEQVVASLSVAFDDVPFNCGTWITCTRASTIGCQGNDLLELRYAEDLKPAEIGDRIDAQPNTVAKALQRIREVLRDCIQSRASWRPCHDRRAQQFTEQVL